MSELPFLKQQQVLIAVQALQIIAEDGKSRLENEPPEMFLIDGCLVPIGQDFVGNVLKKQIACGVKVLLLLFADGIFYRIIGHRALNGEKQVSVRAEHSVLFFEPEDLPGQIEVRKYRKSVDEIELLTEVSRRGKMWDE